MSFPRYPAYKPSGVEWLGEVPSHWELIALKHLVDMRSGESITADSIEAEGEFPVFGGNGLRGYTDRYTHDGEFALVGRQGALCGNIQYARGKFWASEHAVVCTPRRPIILRWFGETLRAMNLGQYSVSAAQPGLSVEVIARLRVPQPSLVEQEAIAAFLDRETARIDSLVADQERLIELLREKRQAVISHAVTRGLDPTVPMKDSGVEWLGEVPAHWDVTQLHRLVDPDRAIMYGIVLPGPDVGSGVPLLKGGNVRPQRMNLESVAHTTKEIEAPYARARLKEGDLVYSIRGTIGDCEPVPLELAGANITQDVARIAVNPEDVPRFVRWALLSAPVREELASGSLGAAVRGINIYDLKRARLAVPPRSERADIAAFLEAETARIDTLIAEAERAITLLQERRSALISAAVTGQIDVRHLVTEDAA